LGATGQQPADVWYKHLLCASDTCCRRHQLWDRFCKTLIKFVHDLYAKLVKDVSTLCPVCCLWASFCVSFIQYLVELVKYHRSPVPPSHMTYALLLTTRIALPPSGLHLMLKGAQCTLLLVMHAILITLTQAVRATFGK